MSRLPLSTSATMFVSLARRRRLVSDANPRTVHKDRILTVHRQREIIQIELGQPEKLVVQDALSGGAHGMGNSGSTAIGDADNIDIGNVQGWRRMGCRDVV